MLLDVTVADNGRRCFNAPCFSYDIRDQDGNTLVTVSDIYFEGANLLTNTTILPLPVAHAAGYVINFVHPQTRLDHRAFVISSR